MKAGTNSLIKQINGKFFHIKFFYSGLDLKANGLKPGEASFNVISSSVEESMLLTLNLPKTNGNPPCLGANTSYFLLYKTIEISSL